MDEEPLSDAPESDENCPDGASGSNKRNRQAHFTYHLGKLREKIEFLAKRYPSCSIVLTIDSPFTRDSFRVCVSRHSTGDTRWDLELEEALKAVIIHKTNDPTAKLRIFKYSPPPITEERLLAALQQCVASGELAPNQYRKVLDTVKTIEKEAEKKALKQLKNADMDFSKLKRNLNGPEAMQCDLTGDGGEGEEQAADQGDACAARVATRERQTTSGSLGEGEGGGSGAGPSDSGNTDAEAGPATAAASTDLAAAAGEVEGGATQEEAEEAAADLAGPSQPAAKRPKRSNAGQHLNSYIAALRESGSPHKNSGKRSEVKLDQKYLDLAAKLVEEVHHELFSENLAAGAADPTNCPRYLQIAAARMIQTYPEGSEDRAFLEAYFCNEQVIRNLVNIKLKLKVAVFKHVKEYEEEKKAAARAAAAAQLAIDRLGAYDVPLPGADAEEIVPWMECFLQKHITVIPPRMGQFKAPSRELKDASRTILARTETWEKQHSAIGDQIAAFREKLKSCIQLAFNI